MVVLIASTNVSVAVAAQQLLLNTPLIGVMVTHKKKRQFLLALFLCFFTSSIFADCLAEGHLYSATVKDVIDGDTLILTNELFQRDRRIRLIGVNTPELDHKHGKHEPFAQQARQFLSNYQGKKIYYQVGLDRRDRYGRYLYYLFDSDRISIGSQLLSAGLGHRVAIPPNVQYQSCLKQVESNARKSKLGIWRTPQHWLPKAGFAVADITIKSVAQNAGGWWLETNLNLVINIPRRYQDQWKAQDLFRLEKQQATVRGWQFYRKVAEKEWVMLIKHPNDLAFES